MVCRSVKYFPKQVQSENTKPGKWHKIIINFPVNCRKKLKKKWFAKIEKNCSSIVYCNGLWFQQIWKWYYSWKWFAVLREYFHIWAKMSSLLLLWIHPHNLSFKFVSNLSDLRCHILCANLNVTPGLSFEFLDPTNLKIP